jgi:hypothetical protein
VLPGNSSVNTFKNMPCNNGGTCVFYVMTSTIEMVFSAALVQNAYKRNEFRSKLVQCRAVESTRTRMEHVLSEL